MKNNQIGIIGAGYWGTNIINVLLKIGCKNIHCLDNNIKNLKEIKKKFPKIFVYQKLNVFLKNKYDGILIATSTKSHYQIARACLEKENNIFVEKPVTNDSSRLIKLINLSKVKKKFIMSGYIYYYNQHIEFIKKILNKNGLGKVLYVSFERLNLGPVRNDISSAWDLSSHDISICHYFFKKQLKLISSSGYDILKEKINDISLISAKVGDIKVDFKSSWLNPEKVRKIVIVGKKKMLLYNEMDFNNPIKIYNKYAFYPSVGKFSRKFFTQKANIYYGSTISPKIKSNSPLENEMREFLKCCKEDKIPKTTAEISLKTLKILEKLN